MPDTEKTPTPTPERRGLVRWLVDVFFSGLLTFLPLFATLFAIAWILEFMERYLGMPFRQYLPDGTYRTGMGIVAVMVLIFLLGLLTRLWMVRSLTHYFGTLLMRVPFVKTIYGSLKDVSDFVFKPADKNDDRAVVMAVLPGGWMQIGIVTRSDFDDLPRSLQDEIARGAARASSRLPAVDATLPAPAAALPATGGEPDMIAVYFPFSYQLGGFTYFLDRRQVRPVPGMSVEDVMRYSMMAWMAAKKK